MMKTTVLKASLLGSSSALGINWMYDRPFLKEYLKDKNPIFLPIDHDAYTNSKNSFDVYPNHKVGDLDFMGEILYLLHMHLEYSKDISLPSWRNTVFNYIGPSGTYDGYIEQYGKELVQQMITETAKNVKGTLYTNHIDKQLIGPALLLAIFDKDNIKNKVEEATKYAKVFSAYENIQKFIELTNILLIDFKNRVNKHIALKGNIKLAPVEYQERLKAALEDITIDEFIEKHSGIACGLEQSFPLIYYIVDKSKNWEEALQLNASLGGASCARGIFISAFFNYLTGIPDQYVNALNYKI